MRKAVALLKDREVPYEFREYKKDPLTPEEIRKILKMLGAGPAEILRRHDRAFAELGMTGDEPADRMIELMSGHPTLIQRPIGVYRGRAVMGRPVERLLELLETRPG